jgi:hypothetical protein
MTEENKIKFDEDGYLESHNDIRNRLSNKEKISGEEAIAFLADYFASETHGNYSGKTLYARACLGSNYKITIEIKNDQHNPC